MSTQFNFITADYPHVFNHLRELALTLHHLRTDQVLDMRQSRRSFRPNRMDLLGWNAERKGDDQVVSGLDPENWRDVYYPSAVGTYLHRPVTVVELQDSSDRSCEKRIVWARIVRLLEVYADNRFDLLRPDALKILESPVSCWAAWNWEISSIPSALLTMQSYHTHSFKDQQIGKPSDLYYEGHVTIEPVFGHRLEQASALAQLFGFRIASLLMQKDRVATPERSDKDTFMTGHSKYEGNLTSRMKALIKTLQYPNFQVWRYKMEDTVYDSRTRDLFQLLTPKSRNP